MNNNQTKAFENAMKTISELNKTLKRVRSIVIDWKEINKELLPVVKVDYFGPDDE